MNNENIKNEIFIMNQQYKDSGLEFLKGIIVGFLNNKTNKYNFKIFNNERDAINFVENHTNAYYVHKEVKI